MAKVLAKSSVSHDTTGQLLIIWLLIYGVGAQLAYPPPQYSEADSGSLPVVIRIGGLFDDADPSEETAFKHAVDRINSDPSILPRSQLSTQIERLSSSNSHEASEKVCEMMGGGVAAIFGPQSVESASHVQSICDAFELPHIETQWDYQIRKENYLINLAPHPASLSNAFNDLVEAFGWTNYAILYEDQDSLFRLQDLLQESEPPHRNALLRQLPPNKDYRGLFREILRSARFQNIIIDCSAENLPEILKQAQQIGLMTFEYSFIITSLDLQTIDLEDYKYSDANITAFRIIDPDRPEVQAVLRQWNDLVSSPTQFRQNPYQPYYYNSNDQQNRRLRMEMNSTMQVMTTKTALVYDAVQLFSKALHVLDSSQRIDIRPLSCDSSNTWQHGYSIINYMKMVQIQGLTGLIQFDTSGYRSDFQLDVMKLTYGGLKKIGIWDSKFNTKFSWLPTEDTGHVYEDDTIDIRNRTLTVTTIMNDPFCMFKRSTVPLTGNDQYEGYSIDLIEELSKEMGFKYEIRIVADGNYGSKKGEGEEAVWNGMIKEILDGVAHIAVADLTISQVRQEAVDFTMPFMNLGISILFTKPRPKPPSLYSFLLPFAIDVWVYMCFAFFGVSFILFIIARITPYEWDCPHPCIEDPDELENQFTLLNSFWFTVGSLMQQGSDVAPKITPYEWILTSRFRKGGYEDVYVNKLTLCNSLWVTMAGLFRQTTIIQPKATSTRMIGGIWWFFTLIMVSSYTANLATFLIVSDLEEPIKSLSDLANQNKIDYGCVKGGSTANFFKGSTFAEKKKVWENMEKMKPSPYMGSNAEGVERVKRDDGKYAFFVESTVLEYIVERECDLAQVGGLLDNKGYGVALPKNSRYRQDFNSAVLTLQAKARLEELKQKWWKEERKETQCETGSADIKPLGLANVGGVFVVLVGGCIFSIFLAIAEFYYKTTTTAKSAGDDVKEALSQEMKFALAFSGNAKPVTKKKDSLSSSGGEAGNENMSGSNPYLDLGMDSHYGFPKPRSNGGIPPDGFT